MSAAATAARSKGRAMDISGLRARRTAYGEQDLRDRKATALTRPDQAGTSALHLARAADGHAALASARGAVDSLGHGCKTAGAHVSGALQSSGKESDNGVHDVRSRQRGGAVHLDAGARNRLRNELLVAKIAEHFSKPDALTGKTSVQVPQFLTLWAERARDPVGFELVAEYAYRNQSDTDVSFLRAVDALTKNPTIDGARRVLQNFIEPLPVDDFGLEIAVPGKSVLNMASDDARKLLIAAGNAAIGKAIRSGDPADVQDLGKLFDSTARQSAALVARNLNNFGADLRRHEAAQARAG